jgi:hypothetical protein
MECVWEVVGGTGDVQGGVGNIRSGASNVQGGAGPLLVRSLASPTSFGARSLPVRHLPDASAQIGRPSASKSVLKNLLQFNIVHMCSEYARIAWHKLGAMPTEEAMQEYITIVQELFPTGIQVQVR